MRRILIVDDDKDYADVLIIRLEKEGYQAQWFSGCDSAIQHLENDPAFDVIILDVEMPERNGLSTLAHLRNYFSKPGRNTIPIIVATGLQSERLRDIFMSERVSDYIRKPFDSSELVKKIEAVLSQQQPTNKP